MQITDLVRRDAEICYLRKVFRDYESIKSDERLVKEFFESNPRFDAILSKYGTPLGFNLSKAEMDKKKFLSESLLLYFSETGSGLFVNSNL